MSNEVIIDVTEVVTIHGVTAPLSYFIKTGQVKLDATSRTGYRVLS